MASLPRPSTPPFPHAQGSGAAPPSGEADEIAEAVAAVLQRDGARIPGATYRVQLNREFTFDQARELVDYFAALGITDLYASPFFRARADSMHGYDLVDHNTINPAIGTREALEAMSGTLRDHAMGLVLDIVPNHMGIATRENAWWTDVLENGPASLYATYFDIDWSPLKSELRNKVLLPVLGNHYGRALEAGDIALAYADDGAFELRVYGNPLPLDPRTYPQVLSQLIEPLSKALGEEHEAVLELQSIVTGFSHLPASTETQRSKKIERRRESQVLKKRLATVVSATPEIAVMLHATLAAINGTKGDPRSFDALDALLERQCYRLSFWRVAAEEVNYRRFFDINDLAAIRMENPVVFAQAHRLVFALLRAGEITGLRVDHPDGLWEPKQYFTVLQRQYFVELCRRHYLGAASNGEVNESLVERHFEQLRPRLEQIHAAAVANEPSGPVARPLYIAAEKILSRGETLPSDWPVHGTSGYDFATLATGVLVDDSSERAMTELYTRFTGEHVEFETLVYHKKKLILRTSLASELNVLAHVLERIATRDRYSRDFTRGALTDALREVIASFPVYRTYVSETTESPDAHDRNAIERAIRLARRRNPTTDASLFGFLRALLLLDVPAWIPDADRASWREFAMRIQQLTGPVTAKAVEDTAFYLYNRLVCLNEVGGEPERYGVTLAAFHRANALRQRAWPHSMNATSTHDTKRSEDVRARIAVLSEIPNRWADAVEQFRAVTAPMRTDLDGALAPDANEMYLLFQTFVGTYPFESPDGEARAAYIERLVEYARKATKEAKAHTSWVNADPDYDAAVESYVRQALAADSPLRAPLEALVRVVAFHGMWGSLAQVLLKCTCPGVPDTYQGTELWDFSLVDPDNRRAVDFATRKAMLDEITRRAVDGDRHLDELVANASDGRIKMFVLARALHARRAHAALFADGAYEPIEVHGTHAAHVIAFARRLGPDEAIVIASRWSARLAGERFEPPCGAVWGDTTLSIAPGRFVDAISGREVATDPSDDASVLPLRRALERFPVALLVRAAGP